MTLYFPKFGVTIPEWSKAYEIEKALEPITVEMNARSLVVNEKVWQNGYFSAQLDHQIAMIRCKKETDNQKFNPASSKDCHEAFLKLGHEGRRSKTGKPSVTKEVLENLDARGEPLAKLVLEARAAGEREKQYKTMQAYALAGKVQPKWDQYGSPNSRYTCAEPSLQNRIKEIREMIEPPKGYSFVSIDRGQAEYRTWASLSGDKNLIAMFEAGKDFHKEMGQEILRVVPEIELYDKTAREIGKTVNFAILYRVKSKHLSGLLKCSEEVAQKIIDAYKKQAAMGVLYMEMVLQTAEIDGFVSTLYGRRRDVPSIKGKTESEVHEIQKTAWNHLVAGTAAEYVKKKTVDLMKWLESLGIDAWVAVQMHDEIILAVKDGQVDAVVEYAKVVFGQQEPGFIADSLTIKTGKNWKETSK